MKKRIFVTATNTDIGKTYTTKLLLKEFASRGILVGVLKPIETGVIDGIAKDGEALLECVKQLNPKLWSLDIDDIVPITYELAAAPFVASNNTPLDLKKILLKLEELEASCDLVIIEGAGGLYVPIDDNYKMIDLITALNAVALLVTHCSLGCINDTLLSQKALRERKIPHAVAFNCKSEDESFLTLSEPYFKQTGFEVLKVDENIDTLCDVLYNL
ncbi:MAG: dethiobiotin synthase [Epsilonproteobacteria bacterium]|nr:dethiobiotin synthase [Campylobacterota bacterium]OIO16138.1 MAG: dethiobiotin synthase [Helicobacteraceae bacterium CG1_02_36_14]PIP10150.1 MAG: dethiobiotin synthase [Sulfurimonas sp. CG23_combo_of_CG06-09_8_20_14_all_36_33]PIS26531.1 MAG: dethiobiotin synthase [Sulfurimonas sp. CG08_land_8_20_14_0_20_36_33]PIU33992.1 MAG: dethiobiotin synthase [Sulfurimonas sp. CG07_land_8_20_14_0_80_36_56]PIV03820.1 MAG: dethiobiotin synthase [Sulfurimonas sp. CG03_land_8_20_14_0_80_36_25]PIV34035.1 MA